MGRERRRRRPADRAHPALRAQLARDLRLHRRRLGVALEVRAARLDAYLRTDGLVRGLPHLRRARRRDHGPVPLADRHRREATPDALVRGAAVRRLPRLLHRRHRRDQPPAVRPPRGRHRARRRLPHRVQRHALRPLSDGRVREHDHALRAGRDAVLRRLVRAVAAARAALVPAEAAPDPVRLPVAAGNAAAAPVRPADALRLEGAPAGRDGQRAHHGRPGGRHLMAGIADSFKGFGVTFKQIFKKPITQQYPEYKRPVYPRFRGRHRLHVHENGLEKCVGCSLCAAACPADCIRVVAEENTPSNRVSAGERYARIYEINLSRCIFCGYCELACPFDAITLEQELELWESSRDDLIYTKDMLLAPPTKRVPVADRDLYDTPIPAYKAHS